MWRLLALVLAGIRNAPVAAAKGLEVVVHMREEATRIMTLGIHIRDSHEGNGRRPGDSIDWEAMPLALPVLRVAKLVEHRRRELGCKARAIDEVVSMAFGGVPRVDPLEAEATRMPDVAIGIVDGKPVAAVWDDVNERCRSGVLHLVALVGRWQIEYLKKGVLFLQAFTKIELANELKVSSATISRMCSGIHVQTPFEIVPLDGLICGSSKLENGRRISQRVLDEAIRTLVNGEPKDRPLSDTELQTSLASHGFSLARRTVAKHRARLGYEPADIRRLRNLGRDVPPQRRRSPRRAKPVLDASKRLMSADEEDSVLLELIAEERPDDPVDDARLHEELCKRGVYVWSGIIPTWRRRLGIADMENRGSR